MAVATTNANTNEPAAAAPAKKGRGLSFEEKRKRLSEYFLEKVRDYHCVLIPLTRMRRRTSFN